MREVIDVAKYMAMGTALGVLILLVAVGLSA